MDSTQEKINLEIIQPNLRVIAKNFGHMIRVVFFMLKKSFSKGKLMFHLKYMMMKRTNKIAGKAIHNLIYHSSTAAHHHHHHHGELPFHVPALPLDEYEFSCSNSPTTKYPSFLNPFLKRKSNRTLTEDDIAGNAVIKALEMLKSNSGAVASPGLPGFGTSTPDAVIRQLRITDSPFPLMEADSGVDEAAEEFIDNFYKNLRRQNAMK